MSAESAVAQAVTSSAPVFSTDASSQGADSVFAADPVGSGVSGRSGDRARTDGSGRGAGEPARGRSVAFAGELDAESAVAQEVTSSASVLSIDGSSQGAAGVLAEDFAASRNGLALAGEAGTESGAIQRLSRSATASDAASGVALVGSGEALLDSVAGQAVAFEVRPRGESAVGGDGFELCGPLPDGTTVLEASAGTGKTYAIVGLAVRYVAEGVADISQLLLVTFSRAATQELRERTRERFVAVAAELAEPERARGSADELVRYLADADAAEVAARRARLRGALSEFDAGTIATTHSFCQRMLDELGLAGEQDPAARLVEGVEDLVEAVVEDLYLARYARTQPPFPLAEARQLALAAVADPHARLRPDDADVGDHPAAEKVAFAAAARAETRRRKQLSGLRDFDDLLELLHGVLADERHGPAACARVRERYRVVLVDEFQDTDPLQWEILRLAFHGHHTLILVGDPKQAIYAFRGAEVLSYLSAVEAADHRYELTTNRRSDAGLLAALDHLLTGAELGHRQITVPPVSGVHPGSRLSGPQGAAIPLRLRCFPRTGAGPLNKSGFPVVGRQRDRVVADLAADVVALLESGTMCGDRPLGAGDIAVLVRTRAQVDLVRDALERAGVPAVLAGGASVFATRSATDWLWLLRALEQPHRADRVRLAASTALLGVSAAEIDSGGADLVGRLGSRLRDAARLFGRAGFAAVYDRIATESELAPRLLGTIGGERELTDLRHIAQLLDQVAVREQLGLSALTRWLGDRVRDPASGVVSDRSRRLDRDAAAVQIATVHASKGLEFPVVYLPFAWDSAKPFTRTTMLFHERGVRYLDVGGGGGRDRSGGDKPPGHDERKALCEAEEAGEELRLLYVALTRARSQVVAWWAPAFGTDCSPLHRLIAGRAPGTGEVPQRTRVAADSVALQQISQWAAAAGPGLIAVETAGGQATATTPWRPPAAVAGEPAAARFDRTVDHAWRRTSYSALTAGAHAAHGPELPGLSDEPDEPALLTADDAEFASAAPSLFNTMPFGAEFGTLVHAVLEHVDTAATDLAAEVRARCAAAVAEVRAELDADALSAALLAVLRTPLAPGTALGALAAIAPADRLAELDFELPLAGGDTPAARNATLPAIAALLRAHLPADDPFAGYPDLLAELDDAPLRGYLTGSIDAVLRTSEPAFHVVDYKTNRIGAGDLTVAHFTRERMAQEMLRSHYPLQALLYSVALHRYLRWRLPGYDPARHLGGVRYLFVRGMIGPATPPGCGVFDWRPPSDLILALSDLLAGRDSR
ncbi:AAA family ATPase [Nocardia stercoris]|uniref:RecBCD enzyme subunit RecB n=2 Tax=Nocardia stercoris TaxID=2483361 RepID=A0A3M2L5Y3_9NOCA|nr:AAA family ATPase [Nocardia stercoris]